MLISCTAGAVHSPLGASDSMTSSDGMESVPAGTRTRVVGSRFNFSVLKALSANSLDECNELHDTWFVRPMPTTASNVQTSFAICAGMREMWTLLEPRHYLTVAKATQPRLHSAKT
jgi:hypothetical protein